MKLMQVIGIACSFLHLAVPVAADDWPTHMHDNSRTGVSSETLTLPMRLDWSYRLPHAPKPAWPEPAKQDYWNRKTNLVPRVVHDRANGIVVANDVVVFGSSADDQVRALNASSGELIWSCFAEGPIRLAPTIWKDVVVFAADDGCAYGVELATGKRLWKTKPPEVGDRRIPGNGRIISERPIRSGILVDETGTGFFTAGIFPLQNAYFFSIDLRDGRILDRAKIEKSVQGYLEQRDGRVFAPTGRDPKGTLLSARGHTSAARPRSQALPAETFTRISDSKHQFLGKRDLVVAMTETGQEAWRAQVDGRVYAMAIAGGQLFVSTSEGWLYGFQPDSPKAILKRRAETDGNDRRPSENTRSASTTGRPRPGYALFVNPNLEEVLGSAAKSTMQTVVVVGDEDRAERFRWRLAEKGFYGRVVVHAHPSYDNLPYAERIFNRIVGGRIDQVKHLLNPGGVAECDDGNFQSDAIPAADGWTHTYGDSGNSAASQARVGQNLQLQWFGGPGPRNMVDRHMRTMPPLVCGGRMYIPGLDRVITVDAFNGTVQWELEIPGSTRIGILKDCGWMVADEEQLYVASKNRCQSYATTIAGTPTESTSFDVPFAERDWAYLARVGDLLIGSSTLANASRRTINRDAILEGAYTDNRPIVGSDGLFCFNMRSGELSWSRKSVGSILNPSIATNDTAIFYLENLTIKLNETETGRVELGPFLAGSARLTAVDVTKGEPRWSVDLPEISDVQSAFVLCDADRVIFVNSRNDQTVHYDVRVFTADSGELLWTATQDNSDRIGGNHGEQDKHPVLAGNRLIVEPFAYKLDTGDQITEFDLRKRGYGCGTISASLEALFFRSGNPASYLFASNAIEPINSVSRPGCWINMIPASGLLLIPEGSAGCTCNYPVQTSMAFAPR